MGLFKVSSQGFLEDSNRSQRRPKTEKKFTAIVVVVQFFLLIPPPFLPVWIIQGGEHTQCSCLLFSSQQPHEISWAKKETGGLELTGSWLLGQHTPSLYGEFSSNPLSCFFLSHRCNEKGERHLLFRRNLSSVTILNRIE